MGDAQEITQTRLRQVREGSRCCGRAINLASIRTRSGGVEQYFQLHAASAFPNFAQTGPVTNGLALVKLMPIYSASSNLLLILAASGGLLLLLLRRPRPALITPWGSPRPATALRSCLQPPEAPTAGRPPAPDLPRSSSGTPFPPAARGELILVVDDESSVRDLLSTVLLNHGYQVAVARDGAEGLRLFSANPDRISLVLSDVYMPNISGKSFAELIRPIRPDVRILFMSGLDGSEQGPEAGRVASRDPFLLKPFKPAALLEKIHKLLHSEAR